jgi:hypothetical protein
MNTKIITVPINFGEMAEDGHYDNCAICKLLRKSEKENREPTQREIDKAFKEAGRQGNVVWDPSFF